MLRIILSLSFMMIFAFAQSCDFSNKNQEECEIDIDNPPIFLHKFIDDNNKSYIEPAACIINGNTQIDDDEYTVIDCSNVESKRGHLTEGITFSNNSNLLKTKQVSLKQDNILIIAAGDVVVDSGIRFNTTKSKNAILEIIEGTNNRSNLILKRGSALNLAAIIMPEGKNSSIKLNTFYGGIYEKDFIDMINSADMLKRADMDTALNVEAVFSLSNNGDISQYSGNLICGPEKNPLDINDKKYLLKRLFSVKNTSKDKPNSSNSICNVEEGGCFDNLVAFSGKKIDEKSYKVATARQNLIPTYDIFIEGGKVGSKSNQKLQDLFSKAKIDGQNYGKCNEPTSIAFDNNIKEQYLAQIQEQMQKSNMIAQNSTANDTKDSNTDSSSLAESSNTKIEDKIAESSADSNDNAKVESNIESSSIAKSNVESSDIIKEEPKQDIDSTTLDSNKLADSSTQDSTKNSNLDEFVKDKKEIYGSNDNVAPAPSPNATQNATIDNNIKDSNTDSNLGDILAQEPTKNNKVESLNDSFLMVEKDAYDKFNKECHGDTKCLYDSLLAYDKVVWSKVSSSKKNNSIYILNLSNAPLDVQCEVSNYYNKSIKKSYNLNANNNIGKLNLVFPSSANKAQITCKANDITKTSNIISVTPAKFDMKYAFKNESIGVTDTINAGDVQIAFKPSMALTLEGEVDKGFSGNLVANNNDITFEEKNKCSGENPNVGISKDINLSFKNGILQNKFINISANTISFGTLNINFKLDNARFCKNDELGLEPSCLKTSISKDLSIIPANFKLTSNIVSDNKLSYYGQLEDRVSFKFNPMLKVKIEALNNKNESLDVNKSCNYAQIQLGLKNDKLIEFKRSISDRLNSKINVYLNDFSSDKSTDIDVFFGINKIADEYKNVRIMRQNDLLEPQEITLEDLSFNLKFKNSGKIYDYNDLIVDNKSKDSVLIARGNLEVSDIRGDTKTPASLVAKYAIYCKSCDKKLLSKYLQADPEISSQSWYINTKHPSDFYLDDSFIQTSPKDIININNSKKALEGRQEISFSSSKEGNYTASINQTTSAFPPYLNYNESNKFSKKTFSIDIAKAKEDEVDNIIEDINKIKDSKNVESKKPDSTKNKDSKPKPTTKPKPAAKPKSQDSSIKLDIES